jgi:hypothetical protein
MFTFVDFYTRRPSFAVDAAALGHALTRRRGARVLEVLDVMLGVLEGILHVVKY